MHYCWYATINILENAFNFDAIAYKFKGIKYYYSCRMFSSAHLYKSSPSSLSFPMANMSKVWANAPILLSFSNQPPILHPFMRDSFNPFFNRQIFSVWWMFKMMEIRWMNSDVLRLNGVDGLLTRKKKKKVMVENSWLLRIRWWWWRAK